MDAACGRLRQHALQPSQRDQHCQRQEPKAVSVMQDGIPHGHEGQPLVVNNTIYMVTPFPNDLIAFDLTKPGFPMKWKYQPHPDPQAQGVACCDLVNRGASYADGKIFYVALDNTAVAVDANTGQEVWRTQVGDIHLGETTTMAPLVVKNVIIIGDSGGELGVRGKVTALEIKTGKLVWRAYNTGPDKDVLIGSDFHPFYAKDQGTDLGEKTWPPDAWKIGGGHSLGLDFLRPGIGPDLLRHRESRTVESRHASRRQQMVDHTMGAQS